MQLSGRNNFSALSADEFEKIIDLLNIGSPDNIAVAVSGGADSMALTLLLNEYCQSHNISLVALTVDHGLRQKSNQEAEQVGKWLRERGIEHHILTWVGHKPDANIQDEARNARYALMGQWCVDNEIEHLFLAHHMNDQAETFLIRLFRGSGIDGLSAMDKIASFPLSNAIGLYPKIYRPLLDISKDRLVAYLKAYGQQWIEDPSNQNEKYTRIQIRELLRSSDIEGFDIERLSSTAEKMRRVRSLLESLTENAESEFVCYHKYGYAVLNSEFHQKLHEEISLRLLSDILKNVSGNTYPPRYNKLEFLFQNLKSDDFSGQTLSGVILFKNSEKDIIFCREYEDIDKRMNIKQSKRCLWDNRFVIDTKSISGEIVPFEQDIIGRVVQKVPDFKKRLSGLFTDHRIRDRVVPTWPCIIDVENKLWLPDFLLQETGITDFNGFSVVFKK
ncbi:MAG: tRNA lysidine(34) synthetase TilS [Kordiimonadaceae bacterium]|nr:tRNA lysidine(34) synthetase TilS [Kordiimonadaceae bacterium]